MRVFPDTNVLVSGLMGHGLCRDLLDRLIIEHTVLLGAPVHKELHRVLTSKFHVPSALWHVLNVRLQALEQASAASASPAIPIVDPEDIPVLACALSAKADIIITGDQLLLGLKKIERIPILSPRQTWQLWVVPEKKPG